MPININFKGKQVLVTGATQGIGAAIAKDFHSTGANLILAGTNQNKIDELNEINKHKQIKNIRYIIADFSDEKSFKKR